MNSIETLAKQRGGIIEALSLVGLSTSWIGAFASQPSLFKQYLRDHRRNSARVVHPDQGQTDLSKKAGEIYPAFDLLSETDDDVLANAMREFLDKFSIPRIEVVSLISSLKSGKENAEREVARLQQVEREYKKSLNTKQSTVEAGLALEMLQLPFSGPKDVNPDTELIRLQDLRERPFFTPIAIEELAGEEPAGYPGSVNGSCYVCYISSEGEMYYDEIFEEFKDKTIPRSKIREEVIQKAYKKAKIISAKQVGLSHQAGNVLGLVNSEYGVETHGDAVGSQLLPTTVESPENLRTIKADVKEFLLSCKESLLGTGVLYSLKDREEPNYDRDLSFIGVVTLPDHAQGSLTVTANIFYIGDFITQSAQKGGTK